jgi:predicted nuclease of predicted toxin-antitoxin system
MKILIDECLPAALRGTFTAMGHECETVRRTGYGSKKNGELLSLAEGRWMCCSRATGESNTNRT